MILILFAFIAGAASVLTPCVLPLLPTILAFSTGEGRRRVWGLVVGIEVSFIGITLLLSSAVRSLGLGEDVLQKFAAVMLVGFGIVLLVPALDAAFQRGVSRLVSRLPQRQGGGDGFVGGLVGGLSLGLIWAPCAGPIFAAVAVAGSTGTVTGETVVTALAFGAGMFFPLLAIAMGGRRIGDWLKRSLGGGRHVLAPMGILVILTGVLIWSGELNRINRQLADSIGLSSTPTASLERKALERKARTKLDELDVDTQGGRPSEEELRAGGYPASHGTELSQLGPAPEFAGIHKWHNTDGKKLSLKQLRGKVVLVDVWTYSCINCIRTLPYIRSYDAKYRDAGLTVIGLHAPEFEFEKDEDNVAAAIKDFSIRYPVATDPDFATWNRYFNRFWPAKYLIDRDGNIRYVHYGEGGYDDTEQVIRKLLQLKPMKGNGEQQQQPSGGPLTPETYLGHERTNTDQYASRRAGERAPGLTPDAAAQYAAPPAAHKTAGLEADQYAFSGTWTVERERATAGKDARLFLHYRAEKVFLVIGPPAHGVGRVEVVDAAGSSRSLTIDSYKLYTLRDASKRADDLLTLQVSPGTSVYAFTFG